MSLLYTNYLFSPSIVIILIVHSLQDTSEEGDASPESGKDVQSPSTTIRNALNPEGNFPTPPAKWVDWLKNTKGLAKGTQGLYKHCVEMFLGFVAHELPESTPTLYHCWDFVLNKRFFAKLSSATNPSSKINYYNAIAAARLYMETEGRHPVDYLKLGKRFSILSKTLSNQRSIYLAESKDSSTREVGLLRSVYLEIYHSESMWTQLHRIYARLESSESSVTISELTFANGFLAFVLLINNFARSGNISLLESEPMAEALTNSLGKYREQYPDDDINNAPRRLDRSKLVPAVVQIPVCTKTGKPQAIAILRQRDVEGLLLYQRFVRSKPPCKLQTTKFFFNTKGASLGKDVLFYLRHISRKAGLKGFTVNNLRRAMETENDLSTDSSAKEIVSYHLGHTNSTVNKFYLKKDHRHAVEASSRLLLILENLAEREEEKVSHASLIF